MRQNTPNTPDDKDTQTRRWAQFVQQWVEASNQADCIIIGDTNLDHNKWTHPDNLHEDMVNLIKNNIEIKGFQQIIQGSTRFWSQQADSLIDKCWVNCIEKIESSKNI